MMLGGIAANPCIRDVLFFVLELYGVDCQVKRNGNIWIPRNGCVFSTFFRLSVGFVLNLVENS